MDVVHAVASWLHVAAAVLALGYYAALGVFLVPAIEGRLDGPRRGPLLLAVERRALPWLVASVVAFAVSGAFLTFTSSRYTGLGQFFSTQWAVLIVVKHVVVVAMVVIGAVMDLLIVPDAALPETEAGRTLAVRRLGRLSIVMALLGGLVLLLTALAQATS